MRSPPRRIARNIELLEQAQPTDLIRYGLIPEFVGRLPVVGVLGDLDKGALMQNSDRTEKRAHPAISESL